jgi:hypothetical protein
MTSRALKAVAYHEAGHAVAHVMLDVPVRLATIVPEGSTLGQVEGRPMPRYITAWMDAGGPYYEEVPLRVRDRLEREVMCIEAGGIAQAKATRTHEGTAVTMAHPEFGTVVVDSDLRRIIDIVGRLSVGDGDRVPYSQWLHARTALLLDRPEVWASVEAVATALLERSQLSGRDVRQVATEAQWEYLLSHRRRHTVSG